MEVFIFPLRKRGTIPNERGTARSWMGANGFVNRGDLIVKIKNRGIKKKWIPDKSVRE